MKKIFYFTVAAILFAAPSAKAQKLNALTKVNQMVKMLFAQRMQKNEAATATATSTMKQCLSTTYIYNNGNWQQEATTKTEYNKKGYTTAIETRGNDVCTRAENTYDETLDGFVTKTTAYSWDDATSTWTNPIVTSQTDLERDSKGRVVKETSYVYDTDTKQLVKESEVNFGYSVLTGQMNSIKMTLTEEDMSIPMTITILKWHKYNADKLFSFSMEDFGTSAINDTDNQIESATISMTMQNIPLTGTINGEYTDTSSSITLNLASMIKMTATTTITDSYGSNETTINMEMMGQNVLTSTVTNTNNEHGDCIKTVSTGTSNYDTALADTNADTDIDLNQTLTYDYVYTTLPDNSIQKVSVVTNILDNTTSEMKPASKVTYDQYVDYITGTTGIRSLHANTPKDQINAIYSINGAKVDNLSSGTAKDIYIAKEANRTVKIMK